jgi:hypothetical protein
MNRRAAIPAIAAVTFLAGFGVAELTGLRLLGGLVLIAGGTWCAREALPLVGRWRTGALLAIALALFVVSHPLGHAIGAWPAVAVSAALVAVAAILFVTPGGVGTPPIGGIRSIRSED